MGHGSVIVGAQGELRGSGRAAGPSSSRPPYTVSRPAASFDADANGTELTDRTVIESVLPAEAVMAIRLADVRRRTVRTIVDGWRPSGAHRAGWDGGNEQGRMPVIGSRLTLPARTR